MHYDPTVLLHHRFELGGTSLSREGAMGRGSRFREEAVRSSGVWRWSRVREGREEKGEGDAVTGSGVAADLRTCTPAEMQVVWSSKASTNRGWSMRRRS